MSNKVFYAKVEYEIHQNTFKNSHLFNDVVELVLPEFIEVDELIDKVRGKVVISANHSVKNAFVVDRIELGKRRLTVGKLTGWAKDIFGR